MTNAEFKALQAAADQGTIQDSKNPAFTFSSNDSDQLAELLRSKYNLEQMVRRELANRGLNENGEWVGFGKAAELFNAWMQK